MERNIHNNKQIHNTKKQKINKTAKWNHTTNEPKRNFYLDDWSNLATNVLCIMFVARTAVHVCYFACLLFLFAIISFMFCTCCG